MSYDGTPEALRPAGTKSNCDPVWAARRLTFKSRRRWTMMDLLFAGIGWTDLAMTLNRIAVGAFFMLSGYHKLFNAERHHSFVDELKGLGVHAVGFNQWWVPSLSGSWRHSPRLACLSSSSSPSPRPGGSESNSTSRSMKRTASTIGSTYRRRFMPSC